MSYSIETVEGIAKSYGNKLRKCGVKTTKGLLDRGSTPAGRKALAKESGIEGKLILKWCNMSDLMRVKGVGEEYSELLEAAGVDTVKELKTRKPDNLHKAMAAANAKRKKGLVRQLPGLAQVEKWVKHAKGLPAMMKY
ncbi:MAG: DUF4332 domain-containing protein [Hyphomicrobiaceae bacterium]